MLRFHAIRIGVRYLRSLGERIRAVEGTDADRGADSRVVPCPQGPQIFDCRGDAGDDVVPLGGIDTVGEDDDELVAADARDGVLRTDRVPENSCDDGEGIVAGGGTTLI